MCLVAVFSGIWPQVKIWILMACWFLPTNCLSAKRRDFLLFWSYTLTKWALVEVFILILIMVTFRVHAFPPDYPGARVDSFVEPQYGR